MGRGGTGPAELTAGIEGADSWATDAHKTLNVPYDCGIAAVVHPEALHASFAQHAAYLASSLGVADPSDRVPELSRRDRPPRRHRRLPGASVLNDVVYTQVCAVFGDDERTRRVGEILRDQGTALATLLARGEGGGRLSSRGR